VAHKEHKSFAPQQLLDTPRAASDYRQVEEHKAVECGQFALVEYWPKSTQVRASSSVSLVPSRPLFLALPPTLQLACTEINYSMPASTLIHGGKLTLNIS
jgi:hypothetical protein